uniref:Putative dna-directed rna polymerase i subunit rpa49 isoform x1 n=1 Tax=Anopheles triannulatus TaxID=58253 RepID=A0A2M4ALH0_9DIPT
MSAKITEIVALDAEEGNPVIVRGHVPQPTNECHAVRAKDVAKEGAEMILVGCKSNLYRGYVQTESPAAVERQQHTYIALHNRVTGKMRMVEVECCPQLTNVCHDERPAEEQTFDVDNVRKLLQKYNSKTSQRLHRRIQREKVDFSVMEDRLQQMISECAPTAKVASSEAKEQPTETLVQDEIRVKMNPQSRSLRDLYQAEDLIGSRLLQSLGKAAESVLQIPADELSMASGYLENRVKAVMQSKEPNSEENLRTVKICLYMDVLARLLTIQKNRKLVKDGNRSNSLSPFTPLFDGPIRQEFMQYCSGQSVGKDRATKYTRDKALLTYLALAFVLEDSDEVQVSVIHRSLQISKEEVIMFGRAIGATYNNRLDTFVKDWKMKTTQESNDPLLATMQAVADGQRSKGKRSYGKR